MEEEGFRINGISFDLGNQTLRSQLKYQKNHFFYNPYDKERKVFMFPDVPHLIKLLRNNLFDYGFRVPSENGDLVPLVKKDFEDVVAKNRGGSDLKTAFNLTRAHIDAKGSQRQRVRIAVQTLSNTVAQSLLQFGPETNEYKAKHKAVKLINDWFDTMNSRMMNDKKPLSCGMSPDVHGDEQLRILDKMEEFLHKFHVMDTEKKGYKPKTAWQPWQYGIRCSIRATKAFYDQMVIRGPFRFLLTAKLNQDCLENLFSRIRALGGDNTHPTPLEALQRMRTLLLVKGGEDLLIRSPAVEMEDDKGNPVSDEDIAEQIKILEAETLTEDEKTDQKEREEVLNREGIESQIVTDDFDYDIESQEPINDDKNTFEAALALMEMQERAEVEQREAQQQREDLEKEQQFTKDVKLVFADTFLNSSATSLTINEHNQNMNVDMVHFPAKVVIKEIQVIPNQAKLSNPNPQKQTVFGRTIPLVGRTIPDKFELEIFCNDVDKLEPGPMDWLQSLDYEANDQTSLKFPDNKTISNQLAIRGKYNNISLLVYGQIEKKSDRESQGLAYFSGFIAHKQIKLNDKKEEGLKKANAQNRKRKIEETAPTEFTPLGMKTSEHTIDEAYDSLSPWIFMVSRGGLVVTSNEFLLDAEMFEIEFNDFHGPFTKPVSLEYVLPGPEEQKPATEKKSTPKKEKSAKKKESTNEKRHFPFKEGTKIIDDFTSILVEKFGHKYDKKVLASFSKSRLNIRIKAEKVKLAEETAERLAANKKRRKTVRDQKQMGQLSNSDTRARKQQGQFQN